MKSAKRDRVDDSLELIEDKIICAFTYPRLDTHVSSSMGHLLKSPFCVHPKTGRVCVPFDPKKAPEFDPLSVVELPQLLKQLDVWAIEHPVTVDDDAPSSSPSSSSTHTSVVCVCVCVCVSVSMHVCGFSLVMFPSLLYSYVFIPLCLCVCVCVCVYVYVGMVVSCSTLSILLVCFSTSSSSSSSLFSIADIAKTRMLDAVDIFDRCFLKPLIKSIRNERMCALSICSSLCIVFLYMRVSRCVCVGVFLMLVDVCVCVCLCVCVCVCVCVCMCMCMCMYMCMCM
jgi:DNA primase small subunit